MQQTLGQKFTSQAKESHPSVMAVIREFAKEMAAGAMAGLEVYSKGHGVNFVLIQVDTPDGLPTIFSHRKELVGECLDFLPIDIGCKIEATDLVRNVFVVRFEVVRPYEGGRVQYDFPVYAYSPGSFQHNLAHLKKKDLDQSDLVQAFEILVDLHLARGRVLENILDQECAMVWGLENPSDILRITDLVGFFKQFESLGSLENIEVEVEPFVGDPQ